MAKTAAPATPAELIADYALRALFSAHPSNPLPRQIAAAIPESFLEKWPDERLTPTELRRVIEQAIHNAFHQINR